jgi:hypothetical protein
MGRHMKRLVAGALAVTFFATSCGVNENPLSSHHPSTGKPRSTTDTNKTPSHPSNQTTPGSTSGNVPLQPSTVGHPIDTGFISFQFNAQQLDMLHQAMANIQVTNNNMKFFGATVLSPDEIPQGTELSAVLSGGQAGYPIYVSFVFNTFTLTLLNQTPVFSDMKKVGTTQIQGQNATWYTRSSQGQNLYFLEYEVNGTYVSFTTGMKNITQAQLEKVAQSLTPVTS